MNNLFIYREKASAFTRRSKKGGPPRRRPPYRIRYSPRAISSSVSPLSR